MSFCTENITYYRDTVSPLLSEHGSFLFMLKMAVDKCGKKGYWSLQDIGPSLKIAWQWANKHAVF